MGPTDPTTLETDPRFPSGPWTGFFLDARLPGRHRMELRLTFSNGSLTGDGRDWVGPFILRGRYSLADGQCHWTKRYLGEHDVFYQGYNEGKGIWGVWEIPPTEMSGHQRGGFHIWPEGMAAASDEHLDEEADVPITVVDDVEVSEPVAAPRG